MPKTSAGILLYRFEKNNLQVLLLHPGGPYWQKKDVGTWSIPKGECEPGEELLKAAIRETEEETGIKAGGDFIELMPIKQKSGKIVYAWALQCDLDPSAIRSNTFEIEWPPKSGIKKSFPEIDKAAWWEVDVAKNKIIPGQVAFITELEGAIRKR